MATSRSRWAREEGAPYPLGVSYVGRENAYNFALYSKHATQVTLLLYAEGDATTPLTEIALDPARNKSGRVWHCRLDASAIREARYYAYRVDGPRSEPGVAWHAFDPDKILLDPYAPAVYFPPGFDRALARKPGSNAGAAPLGIIEDAAQFEWGGDRHPQHEHDTIIYELHVRGFTAHPSSGLPVEKRGTYAALTDKIPYIVSLGVTVVELMPVFQFDPQEGNYWGYMPLNFFAPHHGYAASRERAGQHDEFRAMMKAFHRAGIEVVIDVVYNHTVESDVWGPNYSFRGIDNASYYLVPDLWRGELANYSGCGNTLDSNSQAVRRMIMDSLRAWVGDLHVDGFRFDLASVFARNKDGSINYDDPPILGEIASDPELASVRLIAEPWDAGGAYQLGRKFPGISWLQWNGAFRDDVRRFVRGDDGMVGKLMLRLYGSDDLFPDGEAYHPYQSVNYVCSHDGFTMADLVAFTHKRNWANGWNNTDGPSENLSRNHGYEGHDGAPPDVQRLRRQQIKNFAALLFLANGTPMFRAGDEMMKSQGGNTNPYNQDNEVSWIDWGDLTTNADIFRFFQRMIAFRKRHRSIARSRYWREDVSWFGPMTADIEYGAGGHAFAYLLSGASQGDDDLYVMISNADTLVRFRVQTADVGEWRRVVNTAEASPRDFLDSPEPLASAYVDLAPHSIVVLVRARRGGPKG